MKSLSIIFPCFNEADNIGDLLRDTLEVVRDIADDFEIIVVDDGSSDNTVEVVEKYKEDNPQIKVVSHKVNRGYGAALKTGFNNAKKDLVFYTDGDAQFDISEIKKLLPLVEKYEAVTGYRIKRQDKPIRRLYARIWALLNNALFKLGVRDIDCAFKLYRKESIKDLNLYSDGAFIDVEILARIKKRGGKIAEVGVNHYPRKAGKQTGGNPLVHLKAFKDLIELWSRLR